MVFSAALYTTSTTGVGVREKPEVEPVPIVDHQGAPKAQALLRDKHDPVSYTLVNAPLFALAGAVAGFQEAYYHFEKMPPVVSRPSLQQAATLYGKVAKKSLLAAGLGALFCYTEATVENLRGKHDAVPGLAAGAVTGLAFGITRPMPQPVAWPLAFAAVAYAADIVSEKIPKGLGGFRYYGPLEHRPSWNDPAPPRPPILDTGASNRPAHGGHFWRGP
mmetsp:Transcript_26809/g.58451  ORF Transcript_26809/g.58451 Transcript_26809/m.58451 type:complete len:219 (-) Transcript_26809:509-1165(-)